MRSVRSGGIGRRLPPTWMCLLAACWAGGTQVGGAQAQIPYLVQNLETAPVRGGVVWRDSFALGGRVFLNGRDAANGAEPWTTDGTGLGTALLADLCPGDCSSDPGFLGTVGSTVLGLATVDGPEPSLWRSDGTPRGTYVLGSPDGRRLTVFLDPSPFAGTHAVAGGFLYFNARTPVGPLQLWRSDGTRAGTQPFAVAAPQVGNGVAASLAAAGDRLYFVTRDGGGSTLWTSDGSAAGTTKLHPFGAAVPDRLSAAGRRLFFLVFAADGSSAALWVSDGSAAGTHAVVSFPTPDALADAGALKVAGDHVLFVADDGKHGTQLWASDGTAAGSRRLTSFGIPHPFGGDFTALNPGLDPGQIEEVNGFAVFVAHDAVDAGYRVWAAPTSPAASSASVPGQAALCGSPCVARSDGVLAVGRQVLFATPAGLVSTDGTPGGTAVARLGCAPGKCVVASRLTPALGVAFFTTQHDVPERVELWRTDGSAAGTRRIAILDPGVRADGRLDLAVLGRSLVFPTRGRGGDPAGSVAAALWTSDGTPGGTRQIGGELMDAASIPGRFAVQGDRVVFNLDGGSHAGELWEAQAAPGSATLLARSDIFTRLAATADTTYLLANFPHDNANQVWKSQSASPAPVLVGELPGNPSNTFVSSSAALLGQLYLTIQSTDAFNPWDGQVFKSDGTPAGTGLAFGLPTGYLVPSNLTPIGTKLYFTSAGPERGMEAMVSDGTTPGTTPLTHFGFAVPSCGPQLTAAGSTVFFVGWDAASGPEVWKTDGTPGGTALVADLVAGKDGSSPTELTAHQGALYFFAVTRPQRKGLWRTDGTPQGTVEIMSFPFNFVPSLTCDPQPNLLTSTGTLLFFVIDDGVQGAELWKSDGTAAGTALVKDIFPGPTSAHPSWLTAAAGRLYFVADDGVHGYELWQSDGSEAGTRMVADLSPGPGSSFPGNLTVAGDRLFFSADDGVTGSELWALPLAAAGGCRSSGTVLCLQGNRFAVTIEWQDLAGNGGAGQAVGLTADTGYFWFFAASNVEVIVKVLDGRPVDGDFWVFYGALSDVGYALTVTDTATGASRRYENFAGTLASVADTHALAASATARSGAAHFSAGAIAAPASTPAAASGPCTAGPGRLCLADGRFAVEATWADGAGHSGDGMAVTLSGDTGYFWFFDAGNVEVVLKVLDGRALNGKFWVFYGALSDVEYSLKVTDTATGAVRTYRNPRGNLASVADTSAF